MAIAVYEYKPVTNKEMVACLKWCQNKFNLRDWNITLEYGDQPPMIIENVVGASPAGCTPQPDFLKGMIWVSPVRAEMMDIHPLQLLIHEVMHFVFSIIEGDEDIERDDEVIHRLDGPLFELYMKHVRKTLPKLQ